MLHYKSSGRVPERPNGAVLKTVAGHACRGFKSHPFRHKRRSRSRLLARGLGFLRCWGGLPVMRFQQGFENIVVLLGHGGSENVRGIRDGLDISLRSHPSLAEAKIALVAGGLSPTSMELFKKKDFHAGASETSRMLYWRPDLVREQRVTDSEEIMEMLRSDQDAYQRVERPVDHPMVMPRIRQDERIKIGVLGDPSQASAELGETIAKEMLESLVRLIRLMEAASKHH
jgi:creatinine amidohydrolase/Fe(II)-dependent formamide hydrolase-like protein